MSAFTLASMHASADKRLPATPASAEPHASTPALSAARASLQSTSPTRSSTAARNAATFALKSAAAAAAVRHFCARARRAARRALILALAASASCAVAFTRANVATARSFACTASVSARSGRSVDRSPFGVVAHSVALRRASAVAISRSVLASTCALTQMRARASCSALRRASASLAAAARRVRTAASMSAAASRKRVSTSPSTERVPSGLRRVFAARSARVVTRPVSWRLRSPLLASACAAARNAAHADTTRVAAPAVSCSCCSTLRLTFGRRVRGGRVARVAVDFVVNPPELRSFACTHSFNAASPASPSLARTHTSHSALFSTSNGALLPLADALQCVLMAASILRRRNACATHTSTVASDASGRLAHSAHNTGFGEFLHKSASSPQRAVMLPSCAFDTTHGLFSAKHALHGFSRGAGGWHASPRASQRHFSDTSILICVTFVTSPLELASVLVAADADAFKHA
mmetsp:Transcript_446/g.578  ORF Transcript_446/g.578 Transcript_446/m.578 type:complete len:467 (+) Transcript_446:1012-2412(+)